MIVRGYKIEAGADLRRANLQNVNLRGADLRHADLWGANLWGANFQNVNLRGADLRDVNLQNVNLRHADLRDANLDFSCWPLWCGSLEVKLDQSQKRQLLYHLLAVAPEYRTPELVAEANQFHRVGDGHQIGECPKMEA